MPPRKPQEILGGSKAKALKGLMRALGPYNAIKSLIKAPRGFIRLLIALKGT